MPPRVEIEDIEDLRRRQGIDDVELREAIRGLRVGDSVRLTFLTGRGTSAGETLPVRITSIRDGAFRGRLAGGPSSAALSGLQVGALIAFTTAQIHSVRKGQRTYGQ